MISIDPLSPSGQASYPAPSPQRDSVVESGEAFPEDRAFEIDPLSTPTPNHKPNDVPGVRTEADNCQLEAEIAANFCPNNTTVTMMAQLSERVTDNCSVELAALGSEDYHDEFFRIVGCNNRDIVVVPRQGTSG